MSTYHLSIKIFSRSGGRSAISCAAYRSGEKLYNEETGITFDYTHKHGIVMNEILLPDNAPKEYMNREKLWNDVQCVETRSDARLCREIEVAFPYEMTDEQRIECVREYIKENFVNKGMIADWAYHNPYPPEHNPHAHILLTCRPLTEDQKWDLKTKSVFANTWKEIEIEGETKIVPAYDPNLPSYDPKDKEHTAQYRIPQLDKNGEQKYRERDGKGREMLWERVNIPTNDWNDKANAEIWRESWARHCNQYLDLEHQIDHRSYERQGIDKEPTIHEGFTARKIEADGNISERMQINREIRQRNTLREQMKQLAREITLAITEKAREIYERFTEFTRHTGYPEQTRGDVGSFGEAAIRDRVSQERELEFGRAFGRDDELKRSVSESDKELRSSIEEIQRTDRDIEETNQRIAELQELTKQKERERDERIEKLRARRAVDYDGRNSGRNRILEGGERTITAERDGLRSTTEDIQSFIASVDVKEQGARAVANDSKSIARDSGLERADREAEQQRLAAERSENIERASRYHGPHL